jgi:hypothetical protein
LWNFFNENGVKGRQQFSLNLCDVSKMPPFKIPIHPSEKESSKGREGN